MKTNLRKTILDYIIIAVGASLFAVSFNMFIARSETPIAMGGITGISMVINYFFPKLSMGLLTFLVNVPFLALGLWKIGGRFMAKTVFASVVLSLAMDISAAFPALTHDPMLCAIYGGIGTGAGLGLVFIRNGSTAGTDIVGLVLKQRYTGIPLGKLVLAADTVIVLCASFAFKSANSVLFAIIKMYAASIATDGVIYGFTTDKLAYIVTEKTETISKLVISELHHGATILTGEGAFTNLPRKMIMCAINPNQIGLLKEIVRENDPDAFMIVTNTHEVLGFGFKPNVKTNL
ncbi:MAG: YitT family protein [Oscillospiraceae bacterium]|nr:YitT family protein [Oscillospiraceae bacterium]MBQ4315851.1 YitT family protein [Oscillospiraceae bacterium]MBQ7054011.1 YitT family protein [Oscillospiraceae bacterium]